MRWLIPRLADFAREEPAHRRPHHTAAWQLPFGDDWKCGITLGDGNWPGLVAEPFRRRPDAVCAPKLACSLSVRPDLKGRAAPRRPFAGRTGPSWLTAAGTSASRPRLEFQYYGQALQAAVDGARGAMGSAPYIRRRPRRRPALFAPFRICCAKGMRCICSIAASRPTSATSPPSALDCPRRPFRSRPPAGIRRTSKQSSTKKSRGMVNASHGGCGFVVLSLDSRELAH